MKVVIVDYGMGNIRSVAKAIEHVAPEASVVVSSDAAVVRAADRVVVPGQGAMHDCMREFLARDLRQCVEEAAASKPFLGVCVGMQMLFEHSEEGDTPGLAILPGRVRRFPNGMSDETGNRLKVPHMGWNQAEIPAGHPVWQGLDANERFYFVHSYYCDPRFDTPATAGAIKVQARYGLPFTCAVVQDNIVAVQFHPEKSARAGLQLLANFMNWQP
ncbi:MAG: imidazole glycerol phosphate synthase subunit HisH [Moraxellaceae bacterium]|nr:imidazole glycerol phosphate synthase subunit HisH [Moraxellaceae bacterium]